MENVGVHLGQERESRWSSASLVEQEVLDGGHGLDLFRHISVGRTLVCWIFPAQQWSLIVWTPSDFCGHLGIVLPLSNMYNYVQCDFQFLSYQQVHCLEGGEWARLSKKYPEQTTNQFSGSDDQGLRRIL